MLSYSPQYAFLTLECLTGDDAGGELNREPFFQTDILSEPEQETIAAACNIWLQKWKYQEFQVAVENGRNTDAARLVFLGSRCVENTCEKDVSRQGGPAYWDCLSGLMEVAAQFVDSINHARQESLDTYYLLADTGRGFFAFAVIDSLTFDEFLFVQTLLNDRAGDLGYGLDCVSYKCHDDAPMSIIQAKMEWESLTDDNDTNEYYKQFVEYKCGGWGMLASLAYRLVSEVESHRGMVDYEEYVDRVVFGEESPVTNAISLLLAKEAASPLTAGSPQPVRPIELSDGPTVAGNLHRTPCESRMTDLPMESNESKQILVEATAKEACEAPRIVQKQQSVREQKLINALAYIREKGPICGASIACHIHVSEQTFRSHYVPLLKKRNVRNNGAGGDGYYLAVEVQ